MTDPMTTDSVYEMAALAQKYADENKRLRTALYDTYGDLCQMVPGFRKPYIEAMLPEHFDGGDERG